MLFFLEKHYCTRNRLQHHVNILLYALRNQKFVTSCIVERNLQYRQGMPV